MAAPGRYRRRRQVRRGERGSSAELREARKRIKLLEQENEVLRRAALPTNGNHWTWETRAFHDTDSVPPELAEAGPV